MNDQPNQIRRNDIIELDIESLAFKGKGVAHLDGFTIFVERGIPRQKVKARVVKKKSNYAEAYAFEVVNHSPLEVAPRCRYFGSCGGCLLQNLNYGEQLIQKRQQVKELLEHIGGFQNVEILPTMPSPDTYFYRNKMEFTFSNFRWLLPDEIDAGLMVDRDFALGLHVPNSFTKVIDIKECFLLSERSNIVFEAIRKFAAASSFAPYTTKDHSGFWRFVVIRESKTLGQMMVNLVTAQDAKGEGKVQELSRLLIEQFPFITTCVHNVSRKKAQIAFGDHENTLFGPGYIEEVLAQTRYRISANSFFQTNTLQAEAMYRLIREWGAFEKNDIVYDLYSGAGGIALFIAPLVGRVVGFELVQQAIADAEVNCRLNAIDNCNFVEGDLKDQIANPPEIIEKCGQPSIVIIDPPRSGLHPKLPERILQLRPERILYVSCDPSTLARDLKLLCASDFSPVKVQPVDMFPNTAHCETVVLLEKK
ncbi:MAG: 23S rRNA (uracil(1939)-C(5))-methyltransferase RlmD [Candidatus Zhuqueibacterota bacterium]